MVTTHSYFKPGTEPIVQDRLEVQPGTYTDEIERAGRIPSVADVSARPSESPFIDSLGPAPNAIILDILLTHDQGGGVTRDTITEQIAKLKQERGYKIPGGRDTCTYWTRQLEEVDLIGIVSNRPKKYRLNKSNRIIQTILSTTNSQDDKFRSSGFWK